jgi:hypothetical protein
MSFEHEYLSASLMLFIHQAIDLIDEATARVKMEKTLKPEVRMEWNGGTTRSNGWSLLVF